MHTSTLFLVALASLMVNFSTAERIYNKEGGSIVSAQGIHKGFLESNAQLFRKRADNDEEVTVNEDEEDLTVQEDEEDLSAQEDEEDLTVQEDEQNTEEENTEEENTEEENTEEENTEEENTEEGQTENEEEALEEFVITPLSKKKGAATAASDDEVTIASVPSSAGKTSGGLTDGLPLVGGGAGGLPLVGGLTGGLL